MLYDKKMFSLKDKIQEEAEQAGALKIKEQRERTKTIKVGYYQENKKKK